MCLKFWLELFWIQEKKYTLSSLKDLRVQLASTQNFIGKLDMQAITLYQNSDLKRTSGGDRNLFCKGFWKNFGAKLDYIKCKLLYLKMHTE